MRTPASSPRTGPRTSTVILILSAGWLLLSCLGRASRPSDPPIVPVRAPATDSISHEMPSPAAAPHLVARGADLGPGPATILRFGFTAWNCSLPDPEPVVSAWIVGHPMALVTAAHEIAHARRAKPLGCLGANLMWRDHVRAARDEAEAFCAEAQVGVALGVWSSVEEAHAVAAELLDNAITYQWLLLDEAGARALMEAACGTGTS